MPHLDGFECVRRVRSWEESERKRDGCSDLKRARIIALSANANEESTVSECLATGFDAVLEKPLTQAVLHELLGGMSP